MAGAALSQGQVQILRFRGRCSTFARYGPDFARSGTEFVTGAALAQGEAHIFLAGAALSQGTVHISRQAQRFRKLRYRFRGRRSTFATSGVDFAAGAALSRGTV